MKHLWLNTVLNRPWLILLIGMLLITAATMGGKNLYFRGDYKVFFDDDNPQLTAFEHMQSTFNKNENAAIIIAPKSGNVFSKETLTLIKNMTDQAWLTPNSSRVDSITNYQHTWAQEDDLIVEDLVPDLETIDQQTIARAREVALKEPNLVKRMVSEKGHVAVINITVQLPDADTPKTALDTSIAVNDITGFIIKMTEEYKAQYPDHDFYHTGIVFMSHSFASEAQKDASTLVPAMFLAIIVVLWLLLRSFTGTLSTLIIIVTTIAATMGLSGWMGYFLSTMFPLW